MDRLTLILAICGLIFGIFSKCTALVVPELTLAYQSGGIPVISGGDVQIGQNLTFTCSFLKLEDIDRSDTVIYQVTLRREIDSVVTTEASCQFSSSTLPIRLEPVSYEDGELRIKQSDILCSPSFTSAKFTFKVELSLEASYNCEIDEFVGPQAGATPKSSSSLILNTHSRPSTPIITLDPPAPVEGQLVRFVCNSNAYPATNLKLKLDGITVRDTVSTASEIDGGLLNQTTIVWTGPAVAGWHGKELRCEVTADHPYNGEVVSVRRLEVIYGPQIPENVEVMVAHNVNDGERDLECSMSGFPISYEWFSISTSMVQVGDEPMFTVSSTYYEDNNKWPLTLTFKCVGTNDRNSSAKVEQIFTVELTKSAVKKATAGPASERPVPGEPWTWQYAAIIVPIALVLIIVIIVIVVVTRRGSSPSVKKTKAAQARRPSDDKADPSRFQSSTASFGLQHDTNRPGNYSENPTLPMEHRYGANVEQFAEAIDDRPGSRKPIALDDLAMYENSSGPPIYGEAPPAYNDMNQYRMEANYSTYSPSYGSSYGAAC